MEEPFEQRLTQRIKQVFGQFEDPSADLGWAELRKKYPPRTSRRPLLLWIGSAAALLLILSGLWFIKPVTEGNIENEQTNIEVKSQKPKVKSQSDLSGNNELKMESEARKVEDRLQIEDQIVTKSYPKGKIGKNKSPEAAKSMDRVENVKLGDKKLQQQIIPDAGEMPALSAINQSNQLHADTLKITVSKKPEPVVKQKLFADTVHGVSASAKIAMLAKTEKEQKPQLGTSPVISSDNSKKAVQKTNKLAFSVYAGSYFNYAEGSENNLNFGAGVLSDIPISRKLKLTTGLTIAKNTLNYTTNNLPEAAFLDVRSASANTSNLGSSYNSITDYQASLLGLDIPVNLKYQVMPESNKIYIAAGVSSGAFLNEKYTYNYQTFSPSSANSFAIQARDEKTEKTLSGFNFARTLNLSFGLSSDMGKTQTLTFEPFLKYPMGGLGSQNLRFGAAGINLKLNFKPAKK